MIRLLVIVGLLIPIIICAQETTPPGVEETMENLAENPGNEVKDDSWNQHLELISRHRIDINRCQANDLIELNLLDALQVEMFFRYRTAFGNLIDIHELQSIPGWDLATIQKILPFITIGGGFESATKLLKRFKGGENNLVLRASTTVEKWNQGPDSTAAYLGDLLSLLLRFKYQYRNQLQFGFTADKDAGEKFGGRFEKSGFDFYSFHFFARALGIIKTLAIGDYAVNMGQGLIMWQGMAMGFNSDITVIKRQSEILKPYSSAGEFGFQRGLAFTLQKKRWEATAFVSYRKVDGNQVIDSLNGVELISSINESGYHRTPGELEDKGSLGLLSWGTNLTYRRRSFRIGVNAVEFYFDKSLQKNPLPYNLYSILGNRWGNYSLNYEFTVRNVHSFGELAIDHLLNRAFIQGMLVSLGPAMDMSFIFRDLSGSYQSIFGHPLTESASASNENGMYLGYCIRIGSRWKVNLYEDVYRHPWLRYGVNAPSYGSSCLTSITNTISKSTELAATFRLSQTNQDEGINEAGIPKTSITQKLNIRFQVIFQVNRSIKLRSRVEWLRLSAMSMSDHYTFLGYLDIFYKPLMQPLSFNLRLQSFDGDSYDARLYAYENDVLYYNYVPFFYGKGLHYYVNLRYKPVKYFNLWLKWSQVIFSGLPETASSAQKSKSELRILLGLNF